MKSETCEKYRKRIEQYIGHETKFSESESDDLLKHIRQCTDCKAYLNMLSDTEQAMTQWTASLEPLLESGQSETIHRLRQMPEHSCHMRHSSVKLRWMGYVAAACILIVSGFLAGRGQGHSINIDELAQMENRITASVADTLQPQIVSEYAKMQDALSDQITLQLTDYAEQTVLRNDYQTYHLLSELIEAIQTAQTRNQQWALSAMQELEQQRLMDQQQVRSELAAFAVYTDDQLQQTQQKLNDLTKQQ